MKSKTLAATHVAKLGILLCGSLLTSAEAWAITYNLSADWSTSSNPNGAWSYRQGGTPLPFFQSNWAGTGQDGWTTTPTGISPPAWLKTSSPFGNAQPGDVFVHSSNFNDPLANVTWTSPQSGVISIAGQAWDVQHNLGRDDEWSLALNAGEIAHRVSVVGVAKNSAAADFGNNLNLGQSLSGLAVNAGDIVTYSVHQTQNNFGHFSGVELTIELIPIPEPAALSLLLAAGLILSGTARRRRT
ncbi:MAG: PEP-CTERM sorting domain-containing protein [Planctomycetes bacterium]|nr:PEP-CTERM sorting domain-containing protein [Planctomycetota bacterium]